ncbi:hypothetical protein FI667_g7681, partial [Globisporangium splendens]
MYPINNAAIQSKYNEIHHIDANSAISNEATFQDIFDLLQSKSEQKKVTVPPADEIRSLRAEVTRLEGQLNAVALQWNAAMLPPDLLLSAYESARQKASATRAQKLNSELKRQLLIHQLYYAALQSGFTESPLCQYPTSTDIFAAIHSDACFPDGADHGARIEVLRTSLDSTCRLAPTLMQRLARQHVNRATMSVPSSQSSIAADASFTYVSTLFVAKIQNATLDQVYDGVLRYFDRMPSQLKHYFGIDYHTESIYKLGPSMEYGLVRYAKKREFATSWNSVFASALTKAHGVVVVDFVDNDRMFPIRAHPNKLRKEVTSIITVTPGVDKVSGLPCVVLCQSRVARYNFLSNDKRLQDEIELDHGFSNGDLLMAVVCEHLRNSIHEAGLISLSIWHGLAKHLGNTDFSVSGRVTSKGGA